MLVVKVRSTYLKLLSKEEMVARFGFAPDGLLYGEKVHDKVLSPHYKQILTNYLQQQGGTVIDGTLTTVYTDGRRTGGIAEYRTTNGEQAWIPFTRLILSLGSQPIIADHKPLFDVIAARGVSILAHVYVPIGYQLPPAMVCGATNHASKLSEKPAEVLGPNGKPCHLYLVRMTAGACVTPNVSANNSANYLL